MASAIIPLITKEGHEYLIKLEPLELDVIPKGINIPIVNITIELVNDIGEINNARTLFQITNKINEYIIHNDVILYCYCDKGSIRKRKGKENISNQHFRSMLFTKMFEKQNQEEYINEEIIINDPNEGDHFIHLFSKIQNKPFIDIIAKEIQEFNK